MPYGNRSTFLASGGVQQDCASSLHRFFAAGHDSPIELEGQFTGGQDANDGPVVQQSDIDTAAQALVSANRPNSQQVNPSQQAGDSLAQVTISVYFTCTGKVYDQKAAFALATSMLNAQASTDPGAGYALMGKVKMALINVVFGDEGTIMLTIEAYSVWVYQSSDVEKQQLAKLLASSSEQEELQLAGNQPGVAHMTIHRPATQQRLPTDPSALRLWCRSCLALNTPLSPKGGRIRQLPA